MSVKFDHVAWRARYNKPETAPEYQDAYLAGKNLNYFHERDFPERHAHLMKTGELLSPLDKQTKKREKIFVQKFGHLLNHRSTKRKEVREAEHAEILPRVLELNALPSTVKKYNTLPKPGVNYETVALVHMAIDPDTRAELLQRVVNDAVKNENDGLLAQCIAVGLDWRIHQPLNNLTDKMSPQDHLKFLKNKTEFADKECMKFDSLLLTQFEDLAQKTLDLPSRPERNALFKGMAAIHPVEAAAETLSSFVAPAKKYKKTSKAKKAEKTKKAETPVAQANRLTNAALHDKDAFQPAYDVVVNLTPSATKTKNLFKLRDASDDDDVRMHLHETAIAEASFKDLIADTVAINLERKRLNALDKMKGSGDLAYLYNKSKVEIESRRKTLDDARFYELNRENLSPFVFKGLRAKPE